MAAPELLIEIRLKKGRVEAVGINSRRRVDACSIAEGRTPEEAMAMIPMLYAVCGRAQAAAAVAACMQANGMEDKGEWGLSVLVEMACEHLWRFHLDWPAVLGIKSDPGSYFLLRKKLEALARDSKAEECAESLERHLCETVFGLSSLSENYRWTALPHAGNSLLSEVVYHLNQEDESWGSLQGVMPDAAELSEKFASEADFARYPSLDGKPLETGAMIRMSRHPVIVKTKDGIFSRFAARMLELAMLPDRIRAGGGGAERGRSMARGTGAACVETARGLLMHRVETKDGKVRRYQILAPTEWNFHPRGSLFRGLMGLEAKSAERLRRKAEMMILALDPCVGHELRIVHA